LRITDTKQILDFSKPIWYLNNVTAQNNTLTSIPEIEFTDPSSNDYSLKSTNPIQYKNLGAPGGPEYFDSKLEQIIVTAEMVIDVTKEEV
jgi:hypothetical protein